MHLQKRPTYFVKNGVRKPVYYSVDARQLNEQGWVSEDQEPCEVKKNEPVKQETVQAPVEQVVEPIEMTESTEEELDDMTKTELIDYAKEHNIDVDPYALKSVILEACKEAKGG
jgi:predicted transcriptional regulator